MTAEMIDHLIIGVVYSLALYGLIKIYIRDCE